MYTLHPKKKGVPSLKEKIGSSQTNSHSLPPPPLPHGFLLAQGGKGRVRMGNKPQSLGFPYVPPFPLYLMKWVFSLQVKTGLLQPYPISSPYSSHLLGTGRALAHPELVLNYSGKFHIHYLPLSCSVLSPLTP